MRSATVVPDAAAKVIAECRKSLKPVAQPSSGKSRHPHTLAEIVALEITPLRCGEEKGVRRRGDHLKVLRDDWDDTRGDGHSSTAGFGLGWSGGEALSSDQLGDRLRPP